ncbi:LOW QUALITY PROTEIN: hypothetical protein M8C21_016273, partial [Ambrosia artemisiifolia]
GYKICFLGYMDLDALMFAEQGWLTTELLKKTREQVLAMEDPAEPLLRVAKQRFTFCQETKTKPRMEESRKKDAAKS